MKKYSFNEAFTPKYKIGDIVIYNNKEYEITDLKCEIWMGYKYFLNELKKWVHFSLLSPLVK